MNKKELEKLISEYKPKYLYQRYNGNLTKYEVLSDERIIEVQTGITLNLETDYLLGKISNKIIDLIEIKDILQIHNLKGDNITFCFEIFDEKTMIDLELGLDDKEIEILGVLTHEQFEERKFYV